MLQVGKSLDFYNICAVSRAGFACNISSHVLLFFYSFWNECEKKKCWCRQAHGARSCVHTSMFTSSLFLFSFGTGEKRKAEYHTNNVFSMQMQNPYSHSRWAEEKWEQQGIYGSAWPLSKSWQLIVLLCVTSLGFPNMNVNILVCPHFHPFLSLV